MKRSRIKIDPAKVRAWQERSRQKQRDKQKTKPKIKNHEISKRTPKRRKQEHDYLRDIPAFIFAHPICPIFGTPAIQIHHMARRQKEWINLKRYWVALSAEGHSIVENNGTWAESVGLLVRIRETYKEHITKLVNEGIDLNEPIFYTNFSGEILGKGEPWKGFRVLGMEGGGN